MRASVMMVMVVFAGACGAQGDVASRDAAAGVETDCARFAEALEACRPAQCAHPHVIVADFQVEHEITGMRGGACDYSQTVPGGYVMECAFTQDGLDEYVPLVAQMIEGFEEFSFSTSTSDDPPDTAVARECAIIGPDGEALPWGTSGPIRRE